MSEIQVYASFPRTVGLDADLNIEPSNWRWVHCLTLPVEALKTLEFSPKPYKWIRYAIGVVVGAQGDLSSSSDSPILVDYDACLADQSSVLYYHTSDEERRRMFPADPKIGRTHLTSSVATTRRARFRDDVAERDRGHKGDSYISIYTRRRSRNPLGADVVQDINSVRNGLFLNKLTHVGLGRDVAFLRQTPNFALNTSDVDPIASPEAPRCTAQLFNPALPYSLGTPTLPSGSPLRVSDYSKWPPAILFDAVYAGAVLHHFGTQALKDEIAATWNDAFYPGSVMTAADADYKVRTDERASAAKKLRAQERERQQGGGAPDTLDMLMALPYILVPPSELQAVKREAKEKTEANERRRVQEKVTTWMDNMYPT
ncbi:hypothetical protein MD484_g8915, partial [Candolleomyces efflorescens]